MLFYRLRELFFGSEQLVHDKSIDELTYKPPIEEEEENTDDGVGEEVTLIWYDENTDDVEQVEVERTKQSLQEINNYFQFFNEKSSFIEYIQAKVTEKIIAVISSPSANYIVDQIHSLSQIDSIFLLHLPSENVIEWADRYTKVIGHYCDKQKMLAQITDNVKMILKQTAAFSLYDQKQKSTRDLTSESGSFLFFQLFKDVLLNMETGETAKKEMITKCSGYYRNNRKEMDNIELFQTTYKAVEAIEWYTKESFVYRLVNKALRTEDIVALYSFRFYVVDLCRRLCLKHKELIERQEKLGQPVLKLYRGLQLALEELKSMQCGVGSLISQNGFLSTSRSKKVAEGFAKAPTTRTNVIPSLFEISADVSSLKTIVLADIAEYSAFPNEEEVLFDLDTIPYRNNMSISTNGHIVSIQQDRIVQRR
ncbi:unnamed protein product [Didymodactylos carnosus]|uniref:NAD(P)(+)--arginine ADP-ribosyltransferase n=1 Tax=Didymodactylos carnosus TaxID=1234261 RepID=A0A8S2DCF6_9BILA|nr:unnamed protein product [Didymodactylos carnosus]CAF3652630.1 unnamed protein product [Didymodactylos carnosus]